MGTIPPISSGQNYPLQPPSHNWNEQIDAILRAPNRTDAVTLIYKLFDDISNLPDIKTNPELQKAQNIIQERLLPYAQDKIPGKMNFQQFTNFANQVRDILSKFG